MYLDPSLGADWLFVAARRYWEKFRPIVVISLDLISYVPPRRGIAITTLARRDLAQKIADDVKKNFPNALHDALVYDYVEEMKLTLDGRADLQQRFGVPELATPTRTPGKGH